MPSPDPEPARAERGARWLVLVACYTMTLLVSGLTYLTTSPAAVSRSSIVVDAIGSAAFLALLLVFRARLDEAFEQVALAAGTAMVGSTIALNTQALGSEMYYLLVVLYAAYFCTRRQLAGQIGLILVSYGLLLALAGHHDAGASSRWVNVAGLSIVCGGVVVALRRRVTQLIASLDCAARTDPLTQLLNRRAFEARLLEEWSRAQRNGDEVSLMGIDVDHFKAINDRHGHPAGDRVLASIAASLAGSTRTGDVLSRVGGEEFSILLPSTSIEEALQIADRIRRSIESPSDPPRPDVTISIGVASARPSAEGDLGSLQQRADRALYLAKAEGRNRVCGDWQDIELTALRDNDSGEAGVLLARRVSPVV